MLGRSLHPAPQIAEARAAMAEVCTTWRAIASRSEAKARAEAEAQVFNQLAVALAGWFAHRPRGGEGTDPTPMNELRLLAQGVASNGGYFPSDHSIGWRPEASVTGYRPGDRIALSEPLFTRLTTAYLDAVSAKFAEG